MKTYNRKTYFFFASAAAFNQAKEFMYGLNNVTGVKYRYGVDGAFGGRPKLGYIEVAPSAAVKYDLDLQFDGLTIGAGSTFSYPKK